MASHLPQSVSIDFLGLAELTASECESGDPETPQKNRAFRIPMDAIASHQMALQELKEESYEMTEVQNSMFAQI